MSTWISRFCFHQSNLFLGFILFRFCDWLAYLSVFFFFRFRPFDFRFIFIDWRRCRGFSPGYFLSFWFGRFVLRYDWSTVFSLFSFYFSGYWRFSCDGFSFSFGTVLLKGNLINKWLQLDWKYFSFHYTITLLTFSLCTGMINYPKWKLIKIFVYNRKNFTAFSET